MDKVLNAEENLSSKTEDFLLEMGNQGFTSYDVNFKYLVTYKYDYDETMKQLKKIKGVN